jgi:hypothetical protein
LEPFPEEGVPDRGNDSRDPCLDRRQGLAVKLKDTAMHVGFIGHDTSVIDQVAGREIIAAIYDDVIVLDNLHNIL